MFEFIRLNLAAFIRKEDAVSSLEYAVLAVIVLGAILFLASGSGGITELFNKMSTQLSNVNSTVQVK